MKKVIGTIILIAIFSVVAYTVHGIYEESKIRNYNQLEENVMAVKSKTNMQNQTIILESSMTNNEINSATSGNENSEVNSEKSSTTASQNNKANNEKSTKTNSKIDALGTIPKTYKGYEVTAGLKIEKLNINTYVLSKYTKEGMNVCVSKYYGPEPNEVGNFCITGHNYITKNMFSKLRKLEIGDEIILTDNKHGAVYYTVYDKYKAEPTQTQALSQQTNEERQVTLITCSDYSKKRIVIKAKERI